MSSPRTNAVAVSGAAVAVAVAVAFSWFYRTTKKRQVSPTNHQDDKERSNIAEDDSTTTTTTRRGRPPVSMVDCNSNSSTTTATSALFRILSRNSISIVHGSVTGTCQRMAQHCLAACQAKFPTRRIQYASIQEFDWWDEFINDDEITTTDDSIMSSNSKLPPPLVLILLPTYTNGEWTVPSQSLYEALQELTTDWRIAQFPLKNKVQFAVYGVGSSAYDASTMGQPARQAVRLLQQLGAKCVARLAVGDSAVGTHAWDTYETWIQTVVTQVQKPKLNQQQQQQTAAAKKTSKPKSLLVAVAEEGELVLQQPENNNKSSECGCGNTTAEPKENNGACCQTAADNNKESSTGCCSTDTTTTTTTANNNNKESSAGCCSNNNDNENQPDQDNDDYNDYSDEEDDDDDDDDQDEPEVMDLEDMGDAMAAAAANGNTTTNREPPEMVTPSQAAALKKEGYKLIGTHSAVKLCRWTKHQLRGRGGCYKHSFYGITSYQCMEATPSLACANKCVFCWRHHKNPVGKEWRWKTDDPGFIVEQAVQTHVQMIKETKGIPGVRLDRWHEAHTVRHCALSLVGEPVMYPRINELLHELHSRAISTFLVTNGQHPAAIESLRPITQLYVSVDAPTQTSLIEIDRPLFNDAWERLRQSLSSLKSKGQRTVARLTVVKGWNSNEISGYAELIALGQVGLVEVKGVTYCGKSDASNLNMSNSPWHHEVVALTVQLRDELKALRQRQLSNKEEDVLPEYDLACEHKHSCSVLLARVDQFADVDPVTGDKLWKTWIDYDKFQQLAARHAQDGTQYSVHDYTAPTPAWALFGANEEGFDPTETRHRKATKHPKYTQYDDRGIPTHDDNGQPLSTKERERLSRLMEQRIRENGGAESVVTESRGGEKTIEDPALMFRGMVVTK